MPSPCPHHRVLLSAALDNQSLSKSFSLEDSSVYAAKPYMAHVIDTINGCAARVYNHAPTMLTQSSHQCAEL